MSRFVSYPTGYPICGLPVPEDMSNLMPKCSGPKCSFCLMRKDYPTELGWERLLEDKEPGHHTNAPFGVKLSCSQSGDPHKELSTQQTKAFLGNFDDDSYFPEVDDEFELMLSQVGYSASATIASFRTLKVYRLLKLSALGQRPHPLLVLVCTARLKGKLL